MTIIRFLFKFVFRIIIYILGILPFCIVITLDLNPINKISLLLISFLLAPFLIIIFTALCIRLSPAVNSGKHKVFSREFVRWFLKDTLSDIILSSSFLNNLRNRIDFLRFIYYKIIGMNPPKGMIMASDVTILDPDRFQFGENVFLGYKTMISGHFVKSGKLYLPQGNIGNNTKVGAKCNIANGVKIGDHVQIGFGVSIGVECIIEDGAVIHDAAIVDDHAVISKNTIIGKKTIIGRKSRVGHNVYIGNYSTIGSNVVIEDGTKLPELTIIKK